MNNRSFDNWFEEFKREYAKNQNVDADFLENLDKDSYKSAWIDGLSPQEAFCEETSYGKPPDQE